MSNTQLHSKFNKLNIDYKYGVVYEDGQFDDSRLLMDLLLTSTMDNYIQGMKGANILSYVKLEEILKQNNKIVGAKLRNTINSEVFKVKCKAIINCAGPFSDSIRKMDDPEAKNKIIPVAGTHLSFPNTLFGGSQYGLCILDTSDKRILFSLPWKNKIITGTTQVTYPEPTHNPTPKLQQVSYLIRQLQPNIEISKQNLVRKVQSKWAGLRPLVYQDGYQVLPQKIQTKKIARNHVIEKTQSGLFSLMGGKWTTYRQMAEQVTDQVCEYLKINSQCRTKKLKLLGQFSHYSQQSKYIYSYNLLKEFQNFQFKQIYQLISTYGKRTFDIIPYITTQGLIKGQMRYLIKNQYVTKATDVLFRRKRTGFLNKSQVYQYLPMVIDILAQQRKWNTNYKKKQTQLAQQQIQTFYS